MMDLIQRINDHITSERSVHASKESEVYSLDKK